MRAVSLWIAVASACLSAVADDDLSDVQPLATKEALILRMKQRNTYPSFGDNVPTLRPGTYSVHVSVGNPDGTPVIALPLGGDDGKRRYKIGTIDVE